MEQYHFLKSRLEAARSTENLHRKAFTDTADGICRALSTAHGFGESINWGAGNPIDEDIKLRVVPTFSLASPEIKVMYLANFAVGPQPAWNLKHGIEVELRIDHGSMLARVRGEAPWTNVMHIQGQNDMASAIFKAISKWVSEKERIGCLNVS